MALLEMVDLADRVRFRPDRLSGGEQQRVALAVALANNPPLLLADEPTGQIDSKSSNQVFDALRRINEAFGTTIIVVTHELPSIFSIAGRVIMLDGSTKNIVAEGSPQDLRDSHHPTHHGHDEEGRSEPAGTQ